MPAVTFMHNTPQISQNCGVFHATFRWTWRPVIMPPFEAAGWVQPAGFQPTGATRKPKAPSAMATK